MTGTGTTALRLTGTRLAQFFRFRCDRQLRYELVPVGARGGDVPAMNDDPARGPMVGPRPGMGLLARAGRRFERRKIQALLRRFGSDAVSVAGWTEEGDARRIEFPRVVELLRDPGEVKFLVQPRIVLRDAAAFARRHGLDPELLEIAPAQPDLIRIARGKDGRPRFQIIDVKWSRERSVHHFAQIAFYALLLDEVLRAEGIDGEVEMRWGWIWQRGSRRPRRFRLTAYLHHVEEFLRAELPRILATEPAAAAWHLAPRCAGCAFFQLCRAEADRADDLARVPGITPLAREILHERGIRTVAELQKGGWRRDTYTGCHALESAESHLKQRAQALRFGKLFDVEGQTHLLGESEQVRVLVSAEGDPVTGTVFALGLRVERSGNGARGAAEVFVSARGTEAAEREMLNAFAGRVTSLVAAALSPAAAARVAGSASEDGAENGAGKRRGFGEKPVHVFVWDRAELDLMRELMQRHVSNPDAQPALAALARILFPAGGARAAQPGTVLHDAVAELFALPVPYAWDLAAVSAALTPSERPAVHRPRDDYGWPFSSQVAFERAHNVWRRRPHRTSAGVESPDDVRRVIESTVKSKLAAVDSVLRAVREQALRARKPRLRLEGGFAGRAVDAEPIADSVLETLRIFAEMEAAQEALAIRMLHALPSRDRAKRFECIRGMEYVETNADGHLVFEFDPECREVKFRPGEFALVLTNDDGQTLLETDRKPWLRRQLGAELVDFDLAAHPPRVILAPGKGFAEAERTGKISLRHQCVLDRADNDFNTARVVATLRRLAEGRGEASFVRGLLDGRVPDGWLAPLDADFGWRETVGRASALRRAKDSADSIDAADSIDSINLASGDSTLDDSKSILNAEQEKAWRAAFERAVTVVWGPPGTGKTYLLAWTLLGLAAAAKRENRPFRVLVTAVTHRAIVNVLVRIARELEASGIPSPLRALKLKGRGSAADKDLDGLDVDVIEDERLAGVFEETDESRTPVVVGTTVWSLWKRMRDASGGDAGGEQPVHPMFDVVVIDEASQMRIPEALVALSSIRRGGRVILAGDDRQLAPIVRGTYPEDDPLFGSVFAFFGEKFRPVALRETRRLNGPLAAYPRELFYPGLRSADPDDRIAVSAANADLADPVDALLWDAFLRPEHSVVFCTYDGWHATARNPFEARLAARIATLARQGLIDPATGAPYTPERFRAHALAILSPHRAQNGAILNELAAQGWPRAELPVVDTVERMQGNEREMILVSYAVADREYAEREAEFLLNPNRFNVSITRARTKLIVFVSDDVLRALPRDERVMTGSMALKGYPRHLGAKRREIDLPAPDGTTVCVRLRYG